MKKIPLSLKIMLRFSRGRRRGNILSLISVISTTGIALGVAVLIIGLSAMNGFERELNNRLLAVVPHGEIEPITSPFTDWQRVIERIKHVPGILSAVPYLNFTGLVECDDKLKAIQVHGIPSQEIQLSALSRYVQHDARQRFYHGHQQIIVGKGVADTIKVKPGDWLTVIIPNINLHMKLLQPTRIRVQVIGILAINSQLDHNIAMIPLADAQQYLQRGNDVGGIAIKVVDIFNANKLVRDAGKVTNAYVKIRSWIGTYGYMYRDIQTIRVIMYLAMVLVISVACFNILSTLVVAVKDKSVDIAILRTLGANDGLIRTIFIWYGLFTGMAGSVIGMVLGVLITLNLTTLMNNVERVLGHPLLSRDIYFINFLPTELHWQDVISVLAMTLLLSLLASWYPARRTICIDPAKVLSGR